MEPLLASAVVEEPEDVPESLLVPEPEPEPEFEPLPDPLLLELFADPFSLDALLEPVSLVLELLADPLLFPVFPLVADSEELLDELLVSCCALEEEPVSALSLPVVLLDADEPVLPLLSPLPWSFFEAVVSPSGAFDSSGCSCS